MIIDRRETSLKIRSFRTVYFGFVFKMFINLNAISKVYHLKNCISLSQRFLAKSFLGNLRRNFCRIDVKNEIHNISRGRQTDFLSRSYLKNFFLKSKLKKSFSVIIIFVQRKSFCILIFNCKRFPM